MLFSRLFHPTRALGSALSRSYVKVKLFPCQRVCLSTSKISRNILTVNFTRTLSDTTSDNAEKTTLKQSNEKDLPIERSIYTGSLKGRVYFFKAFSLSTSVVGIGMQAYLYPHWHELPVALQFAVAGVFSMVIYATPVLMHLITKRYVIDLSYSEDNDLFTATTISFFLRRKKRSFSREQVKIPEMEGAFTSIVVNKVPLFINFDDVTDRKLLLRLLSWDKPIDILMQEDEDKDGGKTPTS